MATTSVLVSSLCFLLLLVELQISSCKQEESVFTVPNFYPKFDQCNPEWGSDMMSDKTVCKVGCLMTSVSMAIRYYNMTINDQLATPGTLNEWLKGHEGYDNHSNLYEKTLHKLNSCITYLGSYGKNNLSDTEVVSNIDNGVVTIANVRNGTHFVLLVGYTDPMSDQWLVNDPYPLFNQTVYTSQEILGYRVFLM